jgi:hypothetical protein
MAIGLGDVLHDTRFRAHTPTDLRFHLRVLYSDPRGINLRNEVAHGLAVSELFGRGVANWVVHTSWCSACCAYASQVRRRRQRRATERHR